MTASSTGTPARPPRGTARDAGRRGATPKGSRPGARPVRGAAANGPRAGAVARRSTFTPRAAILALVLVAVAVSLLVPIRQYLAQRADIAALRAGVANERDRVSALQAERERWADPAYVQQQARERLHFVMPGETAYVVLGQPKAPEASAATTGPGAAVVTDRTWYAGLWDSVRAADAGTLAP